jgi:hypothetical protein
MSNPFRSVFLIIDDDDSVYGVYSSKSLAESMRRAFDSSPYANLIVKEQKLDVVHPTPMEGCSFYCVERDGQHPYRTHTTNALGCNIDASRIGVVRKVGMRAFISQMCGKALEAYPRLSTIISAKSPDEARRMAMQLFDQYEQEHPDWSGPAASADPSF